LVFSAIFLSLHNLLKGKEILSGSEVIKRNVTVRTVTNHIIRLKWRQSQNATSQNGTKGNASVTGFLSPFGKWKA
jgi:hypothetical protein